MPAPRGNQGILHSGLQPSQSKKRKLQRPTKPIEPPSSDDESDNSASSSFPSCPAPPKPSSKTRRIGDNHPGTLTYTSSGNADTTGSMSNNRIDDTNSNSTVSKIILDKFLRENAGANSVTEAIELHRMMMESDDDSSSTGSDFGELWGLSTGTNVDSSDNLEYENSSNHDIDSGINNYSDSSIEIVNPSCQRSEIHSSPVGGGMNGRHLSGRQRRLEAARSKNNAIQFYGKNNKSDESSGGHDGDSSDDAGMGIIQDENSDSDYGDDALPRKETNQTNLKPRALVPTESEECNDNSEKLPTLSPTLEVHTSKLRDDLSTGLTSEKLRSDIENIEARNKNINCNNSAGINGNRGQKIHDNKLRSPEMKMNTRVNEPTDEVPRKIRKGRGAAAKSTSKTKKKSTRTKTKATENGVFDNLFCNGKDFFAWAGISDPNDFLRRSKDYAQQVNLWRKHRNLPLFNDTAGYIQKLRRQIRDNMKSIALRRKKCGSRTSTSGSDRKRFNTIKKSKKLKNNTRKTIYPSMENLPLEGGDFMNFIGIKNIEDVFKHNDLHKHINEWRKEKKMPLVDDERSYIANWRKWIRQNVKHQEEGIGFDINAKENPPDEINFSNCMEVVSSLSKRFLNRETGLPVYQFAVYDTLATDIIYEFRVEAKPSLIPNAGNGAFLTFLGARETPYPMDESGTALEVETMQPLVSRDSEGYHMNIKVVGEHLQGNNKRMQYPPPTSIPPIHGSPEERDIGANKYPWTLKQEEERLLSHYVENSEICFSTNQIGCSVIELGRYGPFQRSDRKLQLHYDLKNFIFSNETSEWGFDIVEDLNGYEQVADVTDDTTGMPHCVAKQNVSMYVNETGGDPKLTQTVWSGQVFDREVNYYFKTEKPMKKGETIELLISYFGTYDEIRERKGYGERNKRGDVLSDEHFPSFLERNFVERYDMVEVIYEVDEPMDLYLLSEFLEKIRGNLAVIVDSFIRELQSLPQGVRVPYAQQVIALRRLNWLKPFFLKKIESLRKRVEKSRETAATAIQIVMLQHCDANAKYLNWASWPILMDLLDKYPNLTDRKGINVRSKFRDEITEDICYGISSSLFCPCNEAIWCDVASTLTHDLCHLIARYHWNDSKIKHPTNLSEELMQKAVEASRAILSPNCIQLLKFDTNIWKRYALNNRGGIAKEVRGTKCVMTLATDCKAPEKRLPVPIILRSVSDTNQTHNLKNIHKPWYLARQILFVADTFAKGYLVDEKSYSFEILRQKLGVASEATSLFLKRDIELDLESSLFYGKEFLSIYSTGNKLNPLSKRSIRKGSINTDLTMKTKKPRTKNTPVRKLLFWDVLVKRLQESGWNIERGNRPNDWYLLPPGVSRGKGMGFKPRVDYFDSAPLVINCLKTDTRYCIQPVIKSIMEEYGKCQVELEKMKSLKKKELKILSNKEIVEHLKKTVNMPVNKSGMIDGIVHNKRVVVSVKVVFHTERLGLLLYIADGQVVVKGVKNPDFEKQVNSGDVMIAVGDYCARNKSLADVCELVRRSERPLTITFERDIQSPQNPPLKILKPSA